LIVAAITSEVSSLSNGAVPFSKFRPANNAARSALGFDRRRIETTGLVA